MEDRVDYCQSCGCKLPPYSGHGPRRKFCEKSSCNATLRYTHTTVITKITHSWSKYDDIPREKPENNWCCQACGKEYPKEMSPYVFPFDWPRDILRICGACHRIVIEHNIKNYSYLRSLVRPHPFE